MKRRDILRYIITLIITIILFSSIIWFSSYINNKKLTNIKDISDKISIDISASETQFQLLQGISCKDESAYIFSSELNSLSEKVAYSEKNIKREDEIKNLKRYYSLLQIKDYLILQKIKEKCSISITPIFYFYINSEDCVDCVRQSAVLSKLRDEYPELRVYSFDYNLELSALKTLITLFKIPKEQFPVIYVNDKIYTGFQDEEALKKEIPELEKYIKERELNEKKQKDLQ